MFNTQGVEEFKTKFINCENLAQKLKSIKFDIDKMWQKKTSRKVFIPYYNKSFVDKIREKIKK